MTHISADISADLVIALLREQHADLAGLPVTFGALGWDNQLWRLGDELAVRLPWATDDASELLLKEYALVPGWRRASLCGRRCRSAWASPPRPSPIPGS